MNLNSKARNRIFRQILTGGLVRNRLSGSGRSVKYEDVYLRAYETPAALRVGLTQYFQFYNTERGHQALNRQTPDAVYFTDPREKQGVCANVSWNLKRLPHLW